MTLPTSGALHLAQIGVEVGKPLLSAVDLNNIELRKLANKKTAGSQISVNDFYGTTYGVGPGYALAEFTPVTGVIPGAWATSNAIYSTLAGPVAIFCDNDAQYSINGGAWTDKSVLGSIGINQTLAVRCVTSTSYSTDTEITVNVNGEVKVFRATTGASSVRQIGFSMSSVKNYALNANGNRNSVTSASITMNIGHAIVGTSQFGVMSPTSTKYVGAPYSNFNSTPTRDTASDTGYLTLYCLESDPLPSIPSTSLTVSTNPGNAKDVGYVWIHGVKYRVKISGGAYAGGTSMICNVSGGWSL